MQDQSWDKLRGWLERWHHGNILWNHSTGHRCHVIHDIKNPLFKKKTLIFNVSLLPKSKGKSPPSLKRDGTVVAKDIRWRKYGLETLPYTGAWLASLQSCPTFPVPITSDTAVPRGTTTCWPERKQTQICVAPNIFTPICRVLPCFIRFYPSFFIPLSLFF